MLEARRISRGGGEVKRQKGLRGAVAEPVEAVEGTQSGLRGARREEHRIITTTQERGRMATIQTLN